MRSINQPPMVNGSPDDFQTPEEALDILIPYLNKDWIIWECAVGKCNLLKGFNKRGWVYTIASDILIDPKMDFLTYSPSNYDCIVTNPPYSLKEKFLERCYELGKPFALLMPLTALESEKRQKLFRKYGLQIIIPNKRYNFETPDGKGNGSWFATAWFTWRLNLPKDILFVEVKK